MRYYNDEKPDAEQLNLIAPMNGCEMGKFFPRKNIRKIPIALIPTKKGEHYALL